jgi:hypothetical protein
MTLNENPNTFNNRAEQGAEIIDFNEMRAKYAKCFHSNILRSQFQKNCDLLQMSGIKPELVESFAAYTTFNNQALDSDLLRSLVAESMFSGEDPDPVAIATV